MGVGPARLGRGRGGWDHGVPPVDEPARDRSGVRACGARRRGAGVGPPGGRGGWMKPESWSAIWSAPPKRHATTRRKVRSLVVMSAGVSATRSEGEHTLMVGAPSAAKSVRWVQPQSVCADAAQPSP